MNFLSTSEILSGCRMPSIRSETYTGVAMSKSVAKNLLASTLFVSTILGPSLVWAAKVPQDACQVLTAADFKALGISAAPKNKAVDTPSQSMRTCIAGSLMAPPMLSLTIQDIKLPVAVEMMRKSLASEGAGEVVNGPWDGGKVKEGADGIQVHFFKGNVSVLIWGKAEGASVRNTLIEIAKRIAGGL